MTEQILAVQKMQDYIEAHLAEAITLATLADRTSMRLLMVASGGLLILIAAVMFWDKTFYGHSFHP